ncbi:prepilin-type N-terminal cleavage/methylation domain-containing protein [bacterium]|nr:prepilin-type N-terminal cleavage/methylation domain-containing protein [bacterium]
MRHYTGQTLIELLVFIVVMGIVIAGSMRAFQTVLFNSSKPAYILTANQLADARMNLIIQQRHITGLTTLTDPCSSGALAACAGLSTFATNKGYTVLSSISAMSSGIRTATVTVSGKGDATVIVRFAQ